MPVWMKTIITPPTEAMSKWIDLDLAERRVILQSVEDKEKLQQAAAIEKDWWVTAVLKALFQTSCKDALSFKGVPVFPRAGASSSG